MDNEKDIAMIEKGRGRPEEEEEREREREREHKTAEEVFP